MLQQGGRVYPGIAGCAGMNANGQPTMAIGYPTASGGYRQTGSIFGPPFGGDPFLQQARAAAALASAELDAKQMSAASMLSSYHAAAGATPDFDTIGLSSGSSSMAAMIDTNSVVNQVAADSMAASLQQHVMAMQHHYQPPPFVQYPSMAAPFPQLPSACGASSIAAAAVIASGGALPLPSGNPTGCLTNALTVNTMSRYPTLAAHGAVIPEMDTDPRELEKFAEHFKQRRIKLGVTQADVGKALAHLKMPGVGSLSQSTICRFESLTLSHNNMVALKPILHSWLEKAEEASKKRDGIGVEQGILPNSEKKRKRTSIAAPEKRLLEEFFRQQPRPTGERISAIADKLDLKKNVVRVWFCNQRQKQKRSQFRTRNQTGDNQSLAKEQKKGDESLNNNEDTTPSPGSEIEVKCSGINQQLHVPLFQPVQDSQLNTQFSLDINQQLRGAISKLDCYGATSDVRGSGGGGGVSFYPCSQQRPPQ